MTWRQKFNRRFMTELGKIWDFWIRNELLWVVGVELDVLEATVLFKIVLLTSAFVTASSMVNDSTSVVVEGFFVDEDFFSGI